jgi:hypothetical protein
VTEGLPALRALLAAVHGEQRRIHAVASEVSDWAALFALARSHGVGAVALDAARRAGVALPGDVVEGHERLLLMEGMRQEALRQTLDQVVVRLAEAAIPHVALKGPVLAARIYDRADMRPSTDLDVLVAPESLEATAIALAPLGYSLEGGARGRFFRDHHHHVHLIHPTLPLIELHQEAYRGFGTALPAAGLLARRVPHGATWVLAPEDEWLYLAVHGASHRFERLSWLYDLELLCRAAPAIRWDVVAARAREYRVTAVVALALAFLSEWLSFDVDDERELPRLGRVRARVARNLARPRASHIANALASFAFAGLLCEPATALGFGARFLRVKLLHEAPLRARGYFAS